MQSCLVCSSRYVGPLYGPKVTCSDECHDALVADMERQFGTHKKVVRTSTGEVFRVPLRDFVEMGVQERDLDQYPRWDEEERILGT